MNHAPSHRMLLWGPSYCVKQCILCIFPTFSLQVDHLAEKNSWNLLEIDVCDKRMEKFSIVKKKKIYGSKIREKSK